MNKDTFRKGLEILAAAAGRNMTPALLDAYYLPLGTLLSEPEWTVKIREALATWEGFGQGRLPAPAFFNRERRDSLERELVTRIQHAFTCIYDGECTKEAGDPPHRYVSRPLIVSKFGEEVALAFDAVGGGDVFLRAQDRDVVFLRNAFVAFAAPAIRAKALKELTHGDGEAAAGTLEAPRGGHPPALERARDGHGSGLEPRGDRARPGGPRR